VSLGDLVPAVLHTIGNACVERTESAERRGRREFTVVYDPDQVTPEALLQALALKKEPARLAG
jgi:hypothetical protein